MVRIPRLLAVATLALFAAPALAQAPIKIVGLVELSGTGATSGTNFDNGAKLAVKEINAAGGILGRQVQYTSSDTQSNPGVAKALAQKAVDDGAYVVMGPVFSGSILVSMEETRRAEIPNFTGGEASAITQKGNPYIFRTSFTQASAMPKVARYIKNGLKAKTVDVMWVNNDFGKGGRDAMIPELQKRGIAVATDIATESGQADFAADAIKVKNSNADAVFVYLNEEESARFLRAAKQQGITKPLVGETTLLGAKVIELAGEAANGVKGHVGLSVDAPVPGFKGFSDTFQAKYGYKSDHNGIKGYTSVWAIKTAAEKVGSFDREAFTKTMHGLRISPKDVPGILIETKWNDVGDLDRSLSCAEQALTYLHKIKLRYGDDNSKLALHDFVHTACEAAVRSAFALYARTGEPAHAARAFQISEQTKAVVLAEVLYKKVIKRVAGVPAALLERERQCHEQIARFEKKLTEPDGAVFKDSLFYAKRQRESLEKQMEENYPEYGKALFGYRHSVSPDSVRRQLPADAALIEYFLGDSTLSTFLLTKDTFWVQQQALPRDFDKTIADFRKTTGDWNFAADSSTAASRLFLKNGRMLYQYLLEKPLALTTLPRLFIVPDGQLNYLPFELLQTREYSGQWIDRDVPFLLADRSVSYRFSCRINPARRMSEGWGGFGMEYNESTLSAIEQDQDDQPLLALRNYGKLPYADDEILAISGILGGSFWLNEAATRKNFLQHAERYGILHLAMHGFVDEQNPLRSRLLFSKSVAEEDPFVYASDLYNLQLTAGLAVLSACQSGTGAWKRGEGVMSLARAFAFAGCPSMVMSLWSVSDQSTSALMVEFYQQLRAGKNKDEALRAAKLRYLQTVSPEYAKPVYWAGFVPVGEMEALPESYFSAGGWGLIWWLAGGLLVLVLLWILYRRYRV